jgi:hypothetical protein
MRRLRDLWPADDDSPWIPYEPGDAPAWTPRPSNPFQRIPPQDLLEAGATPECYLCWQSERTREIVRWAMKHYSGLTIADAVEELWEHGGFEPLPDGYSATRPRSRVSV